MLDHTTNYAYVILLLFIYCRLGMSIVRYKILHQVLDAVLESQNLVTDNNEQPVDICLLLPEFGSNCEIEDDDEENLGEMGTAEVCG